MSSILTREDSFQKIDWVSVRKNQDHFRVTLRQSKRLAYAVCKRQSQRFTQPVAFEIDPSFITFISKEFITSHPELLSCSNTARLHILLKSFSSQDNKTTLELMHSIRSLITASSSYVAEILKTDLPSLISSYLSYDYPLPIIEQAAYIISNILYEDSSKALIKPSLIHALLSIISNRNIQITENSLYALSNISADSQEIRMILIGNNYLEILLELSNETCVNLIRTLSWALSIITKEAENMKSNHLDICVEILLRLIKYEDHEILIEAYWTLSNLCALDNLSFIQTLFDKKLIHEAIESLKLPQLSIKSPILNIIGNVCATTHEHTQFILNYHILDTFCTDIYINSYLSSDVFWILSNIAAGTPGQCEKLLNHRIFENILISIIHHDMKTRVQGGATIKNLITAMPKSKGKMLDAGFLQILAVALRDKDAGYCRSLLFICGEFKDYCSVKAFEESGCKDAVERILKVENPELFATATKVLEEFACKSQAGCGE